jgi:hypothetical protein
MEQDIFCDMWIIYLASQAEECGSNLLKILSTAVIPDITNRQCE